MQQKSKKLLKFVNIFKINLTFAIKTERYQH